MDDQHVGDQHVGDQHAGRTDADLEALLRDVEAGDLELLDPPEGIWEGIEAAVADGPDGDAATSVEATDADGVDGDAITAVDADTAESDADAADAAEPDAAESDAGTVVPLALRRRPAQWVALGVAAAVVAAAVVVPTVLLTRDDPAAVVASASLAYDAQNFDALGATARAGADLVADGDEHRVVLVDAALPAPEAGADLEVWLIRPDAEGNVADLVSLGVVDPADPADLDVPAGYDPSAYFVVDISVEPRDGDAGHSGRSILRGPLEDV